MRFKRDVIGVGNIEREVIFRFTGLPNHLLRVFVHAHITAARPAAQLTWYPQAINLGVVRGPSAVGGQEFTVLVPKNISLGTPRASPKSISVVRLSGHQQIDEFGRTAFNFVIVLRHPHSGYVNDKVTITTTDKFVPKIVVRITGLVGR
jgi:hypothetical protein